MLRSPSKILSVAAWLFGVSINSNLKSQKKELPDPIDPGSNIGDVNLSLKLGHLLFLPNKEYPLSVSLDILRLETVEESDALDALFQSGELFKLLSLWPEVDKGGFSVLDSLPIFLSLDNCAWPFEPLLDELFDVLGKRV